MKSIPGAPLYRGSRAAQLAFGATRVRTTAWAVSLPILVLLDWLAIQAR